MYADIVEMGNAQELILCPSKVHLVEDDAEPCSQQCEEYFDR